MWDSCSLYAAQMGPTTQSVTHPASDRQPEPAACLPASQRATCRGSDQDISPGGGGRRAVSWGAMGQTTVAGLLGQKTTRIMVLVGRSVVRSHPASWPVSQGQETAARAAEVEGPFLACPILSSSSLLLLSHWGCERERQRHLWPVGHVAGPCTMPCAE